MSHPTKKPILGMWNLEEMVECGTKISHSRRCWSPFQLFPCQAGVPAEFFVFSVCGEGKEAQPSEPSPRARLPKKSPQAVKDRFCHSGPCVAPFKGQHHLTLGLHKT